VFSFARFRRCCSGPGSSLPVKADHTNRNRRCHTLRLYTAAPWPLLPYNLNGVAIVAKKMYGDGMTTASFNSSQTAIGTGPYRVTAFALGDQATFQRNDAWWDKPPTWTTVSYRAVTGRRRPDRHAAQPVRPTSSTRCQLVTPPI